ncbi:MAG: hypothetical protein AAFU80_23910 [Pseudomonadota bacterium]
MRFLLSRAVPALSLIALAWFFLPGSFYTLSGLVLLWLLVVLVLGWRRAARADDP